ncbi:TetR/AcrR family transcriptional regulator [Amycolatopsis sp. NPDC059021]|uniref:TetR/AcrR family transcriptional regulator n=1 Tax=Amycolatopsis sp. NPDC059021 TaxID=3346704 RepID=UPI003672D2E7
MPAENNVDDVDRSLDLLWPNRQRAGSGTRPGLSLEKIIDISIRIVDAEGLDALSMQRVATDLGFSTMSLYRYVPGKTQLLDLMVDTASGRPSGTEVRDGDWRAGVEQWVRELWAVYQLHPWLPEVQIRNPPIGPNQLAWFEALIKSLWGVGIPHRDVVPLTMFVSSAVRDLARLSADLVPMSLGYTQVLDAILNQDEYPTLAELVREHFPEDGAAGDGAEEGALEGSDVWPAVEFGLQRLLDGMETYVLALRRKNRRTTRKSE